ncbi:Rv1733c family protein [Gordonia sp. NPDC003376]
MATSFSRQRTAPYRPWSSNPLMRHGDRTIAWIMLAMLVIVLAAVPLCTWAGMSTYRMVTERAETAVPTTATVVSVAATDPTSAESAASVVWRRGETEYTGMTQVSRSTLKGTQVPVWTTADGTRLTDHAGPFERVFCGVWVGATAWIAAAAAALGIAVLLRRRITRRLADDWDREWRQAGIAPHGWASH